MMRTTKRESFSKQAILVLGPHRSGTSLIANSLHAAGFDLGNDPLTPNDENPKGFFESERVVSFNDELLAELDLCWDCIGVFGLRAKVRSLFDSTKHQRQAKEILQSVYSDNRKVAIKDPRLCMLEPFWTGILEMNGFSVSHALVLRHPLESALSQAARFNAPGSVHIVGEDVSEGVQLWASYMLEALRNLRSRRPCLVDYSEVLRSPDQVIKEFYAALGISAQGSTADGGEIADQHLRRNDASTLPSSTLAAFRRYVAVFAVLTSAARKRRRVGSLRLAVAEAMLRLAMSNDAQLPTNQRRLYVRARDQAIERGVKLHGSQEELTRAGNIIRFNEHLIEELKNKLEGSESETPTDKHGTVGRHDA